jgi:hypothetical protein
MSMSHCSLPAGCLYFVMAWVGACVEEGDLGSPKFRSAPSIGVYGIGQSYATASLSYYSFYIRPERL